MKPTKPIALKKTDGRSRTAFYLSTTLAIVLVVVGWVVTVASSIRYNVDSVTQAVTTSAVEARAQLQQSKKSAEPLTNSLKNVKDQFDESVETIKAAEEQKQFLVDRMKQRIEEDQKDEPIE